MNIRLTPEQQKIIEMEIRSGQFDTVEEVIAEALRALRDRASSSENPAGNGQQREAVREMLLFVEKNHIRLNGISVKQLIREGRRL